MKETIYRLAKALGVFAFCRWLTRKQLRILAYHGIWMGDGHFGNFLFMSPVKFARRMQLLSSLSMPVLTLAEALAKRDRGTLPNNAVVITIDDGWHSTYKYMLPVLEEYRMPATVYVTTYYVEKQTPVFDVALQYMFSSSAAQSIDVSGLGVVGGVFDLTDASQYQKALEELQRLAGSLSSEQERQELAHQLAFQLGVNYKDIVDKKLCHMMTIEELNDAAHCGLDIQLHTHRHRITEAGISTITKEISENCSYLEAVAKKPLEHFCYPSGIYDRSVWLSLKELGIVSATTTEAGLVDRRSHVYALPRILDGEELSDLEFEAELCGFGEIKRKLVRAVGRA